MNDSWPAYIHIITQKKNYSVPDLQFDDFAVHFEAERAELHAYRDLVLLFELVVHDSLHQTTLAHTGVADDDQFEQVVLGAQRFVGDDFVAHALHFVLGIHIPTQTNLK